MAPRIMVNIRTEKLVRNAILQTGSTKSSKEIVVNIIIKATTIERNKKEEEEEENKNIFPRF